MRTSRLRARVELPFLLLCCSLCFMAGLLGSEFFLDRSSVGDGWRPRRRVEEAVAAEKEPGLLVMPHGDTEFASVDQCQTIIRIARPKLEPSTVALRKGEIVQDNNGVRTSTGTFLFASDDLTGTLEQIERKIARVSKIPRENGEAFNVLRYELGQRYASHFDAFDPAQYGPQRSHRVATFILYLSEVEEGGETVFPFENGFNMDVGYDFEKCIGLKIKPRMGDGLLFYSMFTNHTIDPTSLHGSCPVIKGEKWVATKWIRDQRED